MTTAIKSSADGTKSYLDLNGATKVTIGASGIEAGSYAPESVTPTELSQKLTLGTAVTLSGTAVDFTGIPSWVKKITVMFNEVSTNGSNSPLVQLGTGGTTTTSGYVSQASQLYTTAAITSTTAGFYINSKASSSVLSGTMTINNISGNIWVESSCFGSTTGSLFMTVGSGTVTLGGVLNRLRITTINGTDTFDAGSVNIMWE